MKSNNSTCHAKYEGRNIQWKVTILRVTLSTKVEIYNEK
jgi:hypothetical protein